MDKYNISLTDASGNIKPFRQQMDELRKVFSGLSEEQKVNLAATLAGKVLPLIVVILFEKSGKSIKTTYNDLYMLILRGFESQIFATHRD